MIINGGHAICSPPASNNPSFHIYEKIIQLLVSLRLLISSIVIVIKLITKGTQFNNNVPRFKIISSTWEKDGRLCFKKGAKT